jgi:hypothetical protein
MKFRICAMLGAFLTTSKELNVDIDAPTSGK